MTAKTMVEVIREVLRKGSYQMPGDTLPYETQAAEVAAALSAAGYGLVADAKREALEEAADDPTLRLAGHSGISITRLRTRAAEMRQGRDAES